MKTPLGRVLGLGSARKGTETFWRQRLSALALVPLTAFVIGLAIGLDGAGRAEVAETLGRPFIAVPLLIFIALSAYHMKLGMQEVLEDYVHGGARLAAHIANLAFCTGIAVVAGYAILKLGFGD